MAAESDLDSMYKKIITETMKEKGVRADTIPREKGLDVNDLEAIRRSLRYYRTKGFASFFCSCRPRNWKSAHAWCILDLRRQKVAHKYEQKCQKCESWVKPIFDEECMKRMARYAVDNYLIKTRRMRRPLQRDDDDGRIKRNEDELPHDEKGCRVCELVRGSCWKKKDMPAAVQHDEDEFPLSSEFARLQL